MFISHAVQLAFTLHSLTALPTLLAARHATFVATSRPPAATCVPLQDPKRLPGVNALLDSAALVRRLELLTVADSGQSVFSVNASQASVRLINGAGSAVRDSMLAAVLAALRPNQPGVPLMIRVHVQPGPVPQITLGRSMLCAPEPGPGEHAEETLRTLVVGGSTATPTDPFVATLRVGKTGEVIKVEINGVKLRDGGASFRRALMANRYRPALLDGEAVEVMWQPGRRLELAK